MSEFSGSWKHPNNPVRTMSIFKLLLLLDVGLDRVALTASAGFGVAGKFPVEKKILCVAGLPKTLRCSS